MHVQVKFADLKFTVIASPSKQASKHTHALRNEVTLVWGSLRLAPITCLKCVVTCKSCHEWKPFLVIKHFMVSATYVPSQDVLEQQTTETVNYSALMELNNISVRLSFIARKLLLLFFLRIKTGSVWRGLR